MRVTDSGDPRLEQLFGVDKAGIDGIKPTVRLPRQGAPVWAIALVALLAAVLLFWLLDSRRTAAPEPIVRARAGDTLLASDPPPLYIPPAPPPLPAAMPPPLPAVTAAQAPQSRVAAVPLPQPQIVYQPSAPPPPFPQPPAAPPRTASGSALVIDTTAPAPAAAREANAQSPMAGAASPWGGRVRAGALSDRANTVPQGMLIPAVLETAFNSTAAGLARAIISRDVRGFDGSKVLIPRGSRLIGEYKAEVADGQKRALISWTRLIRPDGATIALDSPATDTLGRGGVEAHVNNHTFQRVMGSILGSTVDLGSALATRAASGSVLIAAPGMFSGAAGSSQVSNRIVPTLSVAAGTSISVFVARDLEFSSGPAK